MSLRFDKPPMFCALPWPSPGPELTLSRKCLPPFYHKLQSDTNGWKKNDPFIKDRLKGQLELQFYKMFQRKHHVLITISTFHVLITMGIFHVHVQVLQLALCRQARGCCIIAWWHVTTENVQMSPMQCKNHTNDLCGSGGSIVIVCHVLAAI